ncbi:MAG TPA: 50S ribosomal protein L13 [Firmicutes bacterium]|nr:50S ribosomal protein L13 [Candidatus Fermentithermobacillaceae bacterium]
MGETYMAKPSPDQRKWWVIDAEGKPLGRLATLVSTILRGKHKPTYTPSVDMGDSVIILNASKVKLTGKKMEQKMFFTHSGYPGGARLTPYKFMIKKHPERVIETAVKGMLPHTRLSRKLMKRLFVYRGGTHPHESQKPSVWQGGEL